jgi:hypothetical protein
MQRNAASSRTLPRRRRGFVAGFATVMLLSDYLSQDLTEALPTKGGGILKTIKDAYDYFAALPPHRAMRAHWRNASAAILEEADVAEVSGQVKFALVLDDELDFARLIRARWRLRDM